MADRIKEAPFVPEPLKELVRRPVVIETVLEGKKVRIPYQGLRADLYYYGREKYQERFQAAQAEGKLKGPERGINRLRTVIEHYFLSLGAGTQEAVLYEAHQVLQKEDVDPAATDVSLFRFLEIKGPGIIKTVFERMAEAVLAISEEEKAGLNQLADLDRQAQDLGLKSAADFPEALRKADQARVKAREEANTRIQEEIARADARIKEAREAYEKELAQAKKSAEELTQEVARLKQELAELKASGRPEDQEAIKKLTERIERLTEVNRTLSELAKAGRKEKPVLVEETPKEISIEGIAEEIVEKNISEETVEILRSSDNVLPLVLEVLESYRKEETIPSDIRSEIMDLLEVNPALLGTQLQNIIQAVGDVNETGYRAHAYRIASLLNLCLGKPLREAKIEKGERIDLIIAVLKLIEKRLEGKAEIFEVEVDKYF